jgi:elongation factor Ts
MQVSVAQVKELRERSGAGMMECKSALVASKGDLELALDHLRKTGAVKAAKKATRIATEGVVVIEHDEAGNRAVIVEVNSETDFVAKHEDFMAFAGAVADTVLAHSPASVEALSALKLAGRSETVEAARTDLVAKIGENISLRRFEILTGGSSRIGAYSHGTRIGVLISVENGTPELCRDLAMHVAWGRPLCITEAEIPPQLLEKEREIFRAQAAESGKPQEIVEKMIAGKVQKFVKEITLNGQAFVKDQEQTVGKLLAAHKARVLKFICYEVGEGIEKKAESFVDEVRAQTEAHQAGKPEQPNKPGQT